MATLDDGWLRECRPGSNCLGTLKWKVAVEHDMPVEYQACMQAPSATAATSTSECRVVINNQSTSTTTPPPLQLLPRLFVHSTVLLRAVLPIDAAYLCCPLMLVALTFPLCAQMVLWGIASGTVSGPAQALYADSIPAGDRSKWYTYLMVTYLVSRWVSVLCLCCVCAVFVRP